MHHVYKQGEIYHSSLNAKETWILNWTTIDNGNNERLYQKEYWFPKSKTVKVIYIYHSNDFSTFKIYRENKDPKIITKIDSINFNRLTISPKDELIFKKRKIQGNLIY